MRKRCLLLTAALAALLTAPSYALTVDEIIAKNVQAKGGMEKLKAVKSRKTTGKTMVQGMEFPFTIYQKRPSFFKIETSVQGLVMAQAYDGETAWQISPTSGGNPQRMPAGQDNAFRNQSDFDGPLLGYEEEGFTVALVGKEKIDGGEAYHLKLVPAGDSSTAGSDFVTHVYIDAETFLETRTTVEGHMGNSPFKVDTYLSDYKDVGGVMLPHSIRAGVSGQTVAQQVIEKIELNIDIDDSVFRMPGEKGKK